MFRSKFTGLVSKQTISSAYSSCLSHIPSITTFNTPLTTSKRNFKYFPKYIRKVSKIYEKERQEEIDRRNSLREQHIQKGEDYSYLDYLDEDLLPMEYHIKWEWKVSLQDWVNSASQHIRGMVRWYKPYLIALLVSGSSQIWVRFFLGHHDLSPEIVNLCAYPSCLLMTAYVFYLARFYRQEANKMYYLDKSEMPLEWIRKSIIPVEVKILDIRYKETLDGLNRIVANINKRYLFLATFLPLQFLVMGSIFHFDPFGLVGPDLAPIMTSTRIFEITAWSLCGWYFPVVYAATAEQYFKQLVDNIQEDLRELKHSCDLATDDEFSDLDYDNYIENAIANDVTQPDDVIDEENEQQRKLKPNLS